MTYTEIKKINGTKYYYRVKSIRNGKKFMKKRVYLGKNLSKHNLKLKETEADIQLKTYKKSKELEKIIPKLKEALKKNKVVRAGIFGSYARGEQKKGSDIDILIEIPKNFKFSLLDFVGLKLELEDVLGKKVDLVEYVTIKPRIRDTILNEEVRIIW